MKITKSYLKQLIREALEEFDEDDVAELPLKSEPFDETGYLEYIENIIDGMGISNKINYIKSEIKYHEDKRDNIDTTTFPGPKRWSEHNKKVYLLGIVLKDLRNSLKKNPLRPKDTDRNEPYYPPLGGVSYEE